MDYNPSNWFWIIGGDTSRAWSSAAGAYVKTWPAGAVTWVASEAELNDVLAAYGLRGPLIMAAHIKAEAQRRIIVLTGATSLDACLIKQLNALMRATELTNKRATGNALTSAEEAEAAMLEALAERIKGIRAASDLMEAMSPIPSDFASDTRWPASV